MLTRLPFVVATGVGIGLLGVLLVASQLSASRAADDLVTGATPFVSESGLARMRADLEKAELVAAAIQDDGLRRLAALSGETQAELLAAVEARHPELIVALSQAPASEQLAEKVISNLEARRDQFDSAASLPGLGLELHDGVIAQFALATFLVIVGVVGMVRPRRALASVVVAVGVSLVATPLALDHPAKTADTDHLLDSLRPFTAEKVQARRDALKTARRLFNGFRHEVVPEVAARAHASPEAVIAALARANRHLSRASLDETAAVLRRFGSLVAFSGEIQPLLVEADELSAREGMWLLIGPGVILVLAGATGLASRDLRAPSASRR